MALAWANSPRAAIDQVLRETPLGFRAGRWSLDLSLHHWASDGQRAVLPFPTGLEIDRQARAGELPPLRRAAPPVRTRARWPRRFSTSARHGPAGLARVVAGLVIGKPPGITLASWLAVRLAAAELPPGVTRSRVHASSRLAGIGVTTSLFVSAPAFPGRPRGAVARLGIFAASPIAAVAGWFLCPRAPAGAGSGTTGGPGPASPPSPPQTRGPDDG